MSTETLATELGLDNDEFNLQTRDEIEQERQAYREGYLRCSLKLIQMEAHS